MGPPGIDLYLKHDALDSQVLQSLFSLQDAMRQDPAMARNASRPRLRRETRGRPPAPWIASAHRGLRRAGVAEAEVRKELLNAVGLIPLAFT